MAATKKRYPDEYKLTVVKTHIIDGYTQQDVAVRYKVAPSTVSRWCANLGLRAAAEAEHAAKTAGSLRLARTTTQRCGPLLLPDHAAGVVASLRWFVVEWPAEQPVDPRGRDDRYRLWGQIAHAMADNASLTRPLDLRHATIVSNATLVEMVCAVRVRTVLGVVGVRHDGTLVDDLAVWHPWPRRVVVSVPDAPSDAVNQRAAAMQIVDAFWPCVVRHAAVGVAVDLGLICRTWLHYWGGSASSVQSWAMHQWLLTVPDPHDQQNQIQALPRAGNAMTTSDVSFGVWITAVATTVEQWLQQPAPAARAWRDLRSLPSCIRVHAIVALHEALERRDERSGVLLRFLLQCAPLAKITYEIRRCLHDVPLTPAVRADVLQGLRSRVLAEDEIVLSDAALLERFAEPRVPLSTQHPPTPG